METKKTKRPGQSNVKRTIIIISACVLAFILFITMLVDLLLVSFSVPPVFSGIVSKSYENTKYGSVTEGHGVLYSTINSYDEFANGYFAAYKFFFGFKKWDETTDLDIEFVLTGDAGEVVPPPGENGDFVSEGEDIIPDDYVFNMDAVRSLAFNDITAFEFMEKFPGTLTGDESITYFAALPNDYVVRIEYFGNTVNYIHLEDHLLNLRLDLQAQSAEIDTFLLERNR